MDQRVRKLGPYTLVSQIGRGAFGVVWLAEKQTAIATTKFALKLPRGEDIDIEAFKQEAAIWIQASGHPNVVPLIDADIYGDQVVIVSEYLSDGSLAEWLKKHGGRAPSIESASDIISGVLSGLAHLHERRIIHRDLKPENILLQRDTPRLADFGIARVLRTGSYSTNISGTLAYMAPEAFDGKRNERTDIWSVGVIFYQLLSGRLPYDQSDMSSFIGAIMRYDPPPLPRSVPEALRNLVVKALRRAPSERYASANLMRNELREVERILWLKERQAREEPANLGEDSKPFARPVELQPTIPAPRPVVPPPAPRIQPPQPRVREAQRDLPPPKEVTTVHTYMAPAIISIFLCWPLAIPAIIFAAQVNSKLALNDVAGARESSKKAKTFSFISIGIGLVVIFFYVVIFVSSTR